MLIDHQAADEVMEMQECYVHAMIMQVSTTQRQIGVIMLTMHAM